MPSGPIYPEKRVFVSKRWGWEDWIYNGKYCGKVLFIKSGKQTSFHYHKEKDEVIYVQSGMIDLIHSSGDDEIKAKKHLLNAGDAFRIKPGMRHRIVAVTDAYLFETSTHHEDSDSYRINN